MQIQITLLCIEVLLINSVHYHINFLLTSNVTLNQLYIYSIF